MRASFVISLLTGATLCSAASANTWHSPQVWEETNGSYSNYSYDDGLCQYRYSYNNFEKHAQASRYGDCSHIVIGPDGHVLPADTGPAEE